MKSSTDRLFFYTAYLYLALPFLIFVLGFMKVAFALPIAFLVIVSLVLALREHDFSWDIEFAQHKRKIFWSLALIFVWVFFSGVGGFSFQTEDHHYRNAIFRDLISLEWPIVYQVTDLPADHPLQGKTTLFVYYCGYWLPSAVVGKVAGAGAAHVFLLLWTLLGMSMIFYFLTRIFRQVSFKVALLLVFFGGLSVVGQFITNPHLEMYYPLWGGKYVYSSNTWNLFYVFNQIVTPWLIISLLMNELPKKNLFFVYSLCFIQGPFSFMGLMPFVLWRLLKDVDFKNLWKEILFVISLQNTLTALVIVATMYLYYATNQSAGHLNIVPLDLGKYILFIVLEFGLLSVFLFNRYSTTALFYVVLGSLLLIPFFQLGFGRDFVERVSIPAIFILMILTLEYVLQEPDGWRKKAVYGILVIGAIVPIEKIGKSIYSTTVHYVANTPISRPIEERVPFYASKVAKFKLKEQMISDSIKTVNTHRNEYVSNFMGDIEKSVFYKHLAKKRNE